MKFFALMKEHEEDLSRLIVSLLESHLWERDAKTPSQTLENGKPVKEAKVSSPC